MKSWAVFLGGYDLEMVEIAKLLDTRDDVVVRDRHLAWGAKASEYGPEIEEALEQSREVVLIELIDDLPKEFPREHLTFVDHHGSKAGEDRPTSIEQVFALFDFPAGLWTQDLALVAANDRGHIEGLRRAGATIEQIREIRERDRRAQGITDDEERLGVQAALGATQRFGGRLTLVRLGHRRAAVVTDALDARLGGPGFQNLLVLGPDQTLFFGQGRVIEALREQFPGGWFGGELPRRGYWGIEQALPESHLMETLAAQLMTRSAAEIEVKAFHHTLIWPLLMRGSSERQPGSGQSISRHVDALTSAGWKESVGPSQVPPIEDYSYEEMVYFHPFVRDFLFGDGKTIVKDRALRRFKRTEVTGVKISIGRVDSSPTPPIELRVERCEILLLRPQVLLLLVEVSNRKSHSDTPVDPRIGDDRSSLTLEQVLYIQSRLRHIYPPYFIGSTQGDVPASVEWIGLQTGDHPTSGARGSGGSSPGTNSDRTSSDRLTLTSPREAFFQFVAQGSEPPMYAHWREFFGDKIKPYATASNRDDGGLYLQQLIDDRIPSMSFIAVDNPSDIHQDDLDRLPAFDSPELDYDPEFRDRLRDGFQYTRFRHWGTTYYCNGTSFAVVCGITDFTDILLTHFRRHYTHLGVIAHFQHAALLYFADELAETVKELAARPGAADYSSPAWAERIRTLQQRFLKFRTRSYFTEVSNQVQGKDLFRLWYDRLGTQALFDRVSATNTEVYQALENHEMKELARVQAKLAQESTKFAKAQTKLAQRSKKLTASQTRLAEIQTTLSRIAMWGLAISIPISAVSAVFACVPLIFGQPTRSEALAWLLGGVGAGVLFDMILMIIYWSTPRNPTP
jgi:hypothetical protein